MNELDALRADIDRLDEQLFALVAERMRLVGEVREAKRAAGGATFDRAREQEVLRRAEERAAALGIPARTAREVMRPLLEASHDAQTLPAGAGKRVLIVGGAGRMGRRFAAWLGERGHTVDSLEKGEPLAPERIARAELVIVAVPMTDAAAITAAVAPHVAPGALLSDVNSLKSEVCAAMSACPGEALGMHPMFGPTVGSLRRQKIVVCPVKPGPLGAWLRGELAAMGAEVIEAEPEQHDRMMAVVQVLTHFGMMVMGGTLARSGAALADTLAFMSPIYRLEVSMVGRLFSQSAELYREIVMRNPHAAALRAGFVAEAAELERVISAGDASAFVAKFAATRAYFASFSDEAMALSDLIIDTVMSRA
jgi:chorismate mutase / prephenate dehydrogenase